MSNIRRTNHMIGKRKDFRNIYIPTILVAQVTLLILLFTKVSLVNVNIFMVY